MVESFGATREELFLRERQEAAQFVDERLLQGHAHQLRIAVGAPERFGEHAVDETQGGETVGRETERIGRAGGFGRVLPENRGAAFGRDHRIGRVLQHHHDVGDGDRERAARAAFPDHGGDDGNAQRRHFIEVAADRFGLTALFGADPGIGPRGVDESDDGEVELFGELHEAKGLAVDFGAGHAEIAAGALAKAAALLMSDHDDVHVGQTGETAHDRLVVRVGAVAVEFVKVREDRLDVVERIGAVRVAGHLRNLPGR